MIKITTIAIYTFNSSIDTLPEFNSEFDNTMTTVTESGSPDYGKNFTFTVPTTDLSQIISFSLPEFEKDTRYTKENSSGPDYIRVRYTWSTVSLAFTIYNTGNCTVSVDCPWSGNVTAEVVFGKENYKYTDINNGDGTITRTITSDTLPTSISFSNKSGLVSVSHLDISNVTSMSGMFQHCSSLTSIEGLSNLDTSNVTDMGYMFQNCYKLTSIDVSNWNTSNVIRMASMFLNCNRLTSLDVSNFDTRKVTDMNGMFSYCMSLTSLDVSNFDTSKVRNMGSMFSSCKALTTLDLSSFNTSKVYDMSSMFNGCTNLTTLDLSSFNTSNISYISNMFNNCSNLTSVDMNNSDVDSVNDIITQLPTRTADATYDLIYGEYVELTTPNSIKDMVFIYDNKTYDYNSLTQFIPGSSIYGVEGIDFIEINDNSYDGQNLFQIYCLPDLDGRLEGKSTGAICSVYNRGTLKTGNAPASNCDTATANSKYWNVVQETETFIIAKYKFNNTIDDLLPVFNSEMSNSSTDTIVIDDIFESYTLPNGKPESSEQLRCEIVYTNGTTREITFDYYEASDGYDESWDALLGISDYSVTIDNINEDNEWRTFLGCGSPFPQMPDGVESVNVYITVGSNNYTYEDVVEGEVTTRTIYSNSLPTTINFISSSITELIYLDINNITNFTDMFHDCNDLVTVNASDWDTSRVTSMYSMFNYCHRLTNIDVSNWDTSNVTNMNIMFGGCFGLTSLDLSKWDTSKVTDMGEMFANCINLTTLDLNSWDTSQVTNMNSMFHDCVSLQDLYVKNWPLNDTTQTIISSLPEGNDHNTIYTNANFILPPGWSFYNKDSETQTNFFIGDTSLSSVYLGNNKIIGIYIGNIKIL